MMREPVIRRLVFHFGRRGLGPLRRKMEKNDASLGSLVLCFQWPAGSFQVRSVGEKR